jgi:hypothetical protein
MYYDVTTTPPGRRPIADRDGRRGRGYGIFFSLSHSYFSSFFFSGKKIDPRGLVGSNIELEAAILKGGGTLYLFSWSIGFFFFPRLFFFFFFFFFFSSNPAFSGKREEGERGGWFEGYWFVSTLLVVLG